MFVQSPGRPLPLVQAARNGYWRVGEVLAVSAPELLIQPLEFGNSFLKLAARAKQIDMIRSIAVKAPRVFAAYVDECRNMAHFAAEEGYVELLELVGEFAPPLMGDRTLSDRDPWTPAVFAAYYKKWEALKVIAKHAPQSVTTVHPFLHGSPLGYMRAHDAPADVIQEVERLCR